MTKMKSRLSVFALTGLVVLLAAGTSDAAARWAEGIGESTMNYYVTSIEPTSDGGYIAVGYRSLLGEIDAWCAKLDALGNVSWQWGYGTTGKFDTFRDVCPLDDGSYFVTGYTMSYGAGDANLWCLLLGAYGNIIWQKTYGGTAPDFGSSCAVLPGGGYIVVGSTGSFGTGDQDLWCLRLDASGNLTWQKAFGGAGRDGGDWMELTSDNCFIVGGTSSSFASPNTQIWCLKIDLSGNIKWQMGYGNGIMGWVNSIQQTSDGGYILSAALGGAMLDSSILKLTPTGAVAWHTFVAQSAPEYPFLSDVRQASDGGYIAAGELNVGAMGYNAWAVKLGAGGAVTWQEQAGSPSANDSYTRVRLLPDGGFAFAGGTTLASKQAVLISRTDSNGDIDPSCNIQNTAITPTQPSIAATATTATTVNTAAVGVDSAAVPYATPAAVTSFCSSPAAPDLTGSWSSVGFKRSKLKGTFKCVNNGAAAAGPFTIKVYFSKKNATGRKATLVKTVNVPGLAAFATYSFKLRATPGAKDKYVIADVDSGKTVAEDDETNNKISNKFR
ncbi:MAG: CARDB domain-containing protein [Acidobacteriota bacterium]